VNHRARLVAAALASSTCVAAAPAAQLVATITPPAGWSRQELFGKFAPGMTSIWNDLAHRTATYTRLVSQRESAAARKALGTLCATRNPSSP
jgi:hypothetical protein